MPTYSYKCKNCDYSFEQIHGIQDKVFCCPKCQDEKVVRVPTQIRANTDISEESRMRHAEAQMMKDLEKYQKDDNFAANITGQSDSKSEERKRGHLEGELRKQTSKREKIKTGGWNFSNGKRRKKK